MFDRLPYLIRNRNLFGARIGRSEAEDQVLGRISIGTLYD